MQKISLLNQLINLCSSIEKIEYGFLIKFKKNILINYEDEQFEFNELFFYNDEIIIKSEFKVKSILKSKWDCIDFKYCEC